MTKRWTVTGSVAADVGAAMGCILMLAACGGGAKQPGTCPDGTVLRGSDCVPTASAKDPEDLAPAGGSSDHANGAPKAADDTPSDSSAPSGGTTPYDKDAVEAQLKRGARSVKAACGAATDDDGQANGPWGKTTAKITLGRNGHVKEVTLPSPYQGTPVGECVVHAFDKIQFPPYAAPSDVAVDWDVELVKPKR
jgi:hypothetical protein